jgi:nicotinamidase-related amidase
MTAVLPQGATLVERSRAYLEYVEGWLAGRPALEMRQVVAEAGGPERVAIVSVDLTIGFCHQGPLASPRVAALLPHVARLFERAHAAGVRDFVLPQDTHRADAEEFGSFPAHCVATTDEARTAPELSALPLADLYQVIEKNSTSSTIGTGFEEWERGRGPFTTYIVVGDCTDFCIYQAAMALKLRSHAAQRGQRVIVPADCVDTFDIPVDVARAIGAEPHDGDLYHHIFLHSMAINGVEVVATVA